MNRIVVVYQSQYGFTEKYAKWIAEALSCNLFNRKAIKAEELHPYKTIIYGGGLYAGGVNGIDLITKKFDRFINKNIILFTCGLADPSNKVNTDHIKVSLEKVFTSEMEKQIKIFHLRGGIDYSKLSFTHKIMMSMLHKMLTKKASDTLSDEDKEMLRTYGGKIDFTDRSSIVPIISYVQTL
jgi:menaquinone-dependent protoporphyrinogen IX oxidase